MGTFILMYAPRAVDAGWAEKTLGAEGLKFTLQRVATKKSFTDALAKKQPDIILFAHGAKGFDALTALAQVRKNFPETPFILLVGPESPQRIHQRLKRSVTDLVLQSQAADLGLSIRRALREAEERKRRASAEAATRRSEQLLRALIEQFADCAIYVLDAQGRVASWNAGAERLTGYPLEEALGHPLNHCFSREEIRSGKPVHELDLALENGRFEAEGWCRRRDGSRYYANWVITAIRDDSNKPAGFLKIARDMTERKQTADEISRLNAELEQRVRERTAQLEDANHELEAFSYSVSHDLRAPLRHIDGFVEILQETAADKLDGESREYLQTIANAARQMGKLIDALLAFSRLSRTNVTKRKIGLDLLVRDTLTQLKCETQGRKIEWVIHKLPEVYADPVLLKQALINLVANAIKYTRTREHPRIEIGITLGAHEQVVYVRDNGVGFDMRHADKLFGAFQRLHRASEFEGTGVGLANVRRIIHRHGGRTWAEGAVEEGATFYFSLPTDDMEGS